jgi:hypothetical protein
MAWQDGLGEFMLRSGYSPAERESLVRVLRTDPAARNCFVGMLMGPTTAGLSAAHGNAIGVVAGLVVTAWGAHNCRKLTEAEMKRLKQAIDQVLAM